MGFAVKGQVARRFLGVDGEANNAAVGINISK